MWGCSDKLPFAVGLGYAMTPGLRTVKALDASLETKADSYRWSFFLAYDLVLWALQAKRLSSQLIVIARKKDA